MMTTMTTWTDRMSIGASLLFFNAILALALSAYFAYLNTRLDAQHGPLASRSARRISQSSKTSESNSGPEGRQQGETTRKSVSDRDTLAGSRNLPPTEANLSENEYLNGVKAADSAKFRYVT